MPVVGLRSRSRAQVEEALAAGADVLIAQGGEAGGNGGWVGSMVLVPAIVDSELVLPPANLTAWPAQPRALRTPLTDQLQRAQTLSIRPSSGSGSSLHYRRTATISCCP